MSSILWNRLEQNAAKDPDKAAFIFRDRDKWRTVTFQQMLDSSNRLARGLQAYGLTPSMRAALMIPPSVEFFALAFALLKTGIIPVIVDPAIGLINVTKCLKESMPEVFIGNALTHLFRVLFRWGKDTVKHSISLSSINRQASLITDCPSHVTEDSPAAIIYTSGSTGLPKGAIYTYANFAAQLDMLVETFDIQPDEIDLPAFPLYALIDCLLGVTSVIPDINFPVPGKTKPRNVLNAIRQFNVTNMFASPVVLQILATYGVEHDIKLPGLRRAITAGAPAPFQVQAKFKKLLPKDANLFGVYGATETLPISVIESREIFKETRSRSAQGAGICIGRPVDNATVRIIQISDEPIPQWDKSIELSANQIGEITVKGKVVTEEYVSGEDANRLAKIRDGNEVVHRMGDVGYFDEQGRLWYCGRKSQRVETQQGTFFTEQIEGIFNAHPLVYRTALVGVDQKPVLWVELEPGAQNVNKEKIKQELIELGNHHPQAKMIKTFLFMKKFPTDVRHNSKIIREKLTLLAVKSIP